MSAIEISPRSMQLVWPSMTYLQGFVEALKQGWSRDTMRPEAAAEDLALVEADAMLFLAQMVDREGKGSPIRMPDGSMAPRLPGYTLWMWDAAFCGSINLRWQKGTDALPAYCPGHIGYSVVPWKQRKGYATQALQALLPMAAEEGLQRIEITTSPDNIASRKVIEASGGVLIGQFVTPPSQGAVPKLRFRIALQRVPACVAPASPLPLG